MSEETVKSDPSGTLAGLPFSTKRTITTDLFDEAKDKLRILDLEREILSFAIRRLYQAKAEGKITEEERERLASKYKEDLRRIKEEISRGESMVALNEFERMQEEFVNLFQERFKDINKRIEELKTLSGFVSQEPEELTEPEEIEETPKEERPKKEGEEETEAPKQPSEKGSSKTKRKSSKPKSPLEPEKTKAERKVEQIVAEVEKVLKRLGQMEVEE
jgi:hypothetical protein